MKRFQNWLAPPFPPTLREEIGNAHRRALELAAYDRELHFSPDACGRVLVEVRTLDGRLVRTIPVTTALEIIIDGHVAEALRALDPEIDPPAAEA